MGPSGRDETRYFAVSCACIQLTFNGIPFRDNSTNVPTRYVQFDQRLHPIVHIPSQGAFLSCLYRCHTDNTSRSMSRCIILYVVPFLTLCSPQLTCIRPDSRSPLVIPLANAPGPPFSRSQHHDASIGAGVRRLDARGARSTAEGAEMAQMGGVWVSIGGAGARASQ
ncbi:hypothetical protein B0H16DRAFT_1500592 [Mycena metata]|uniref:Uncharacterized protein n=1 Tax=Mycena metata TaxID=1033252 RepID=A0AAD7K7U7_9AGAR|nr:hypothetical protein B0H16DRAFT_1500592 [Mycena metata]